MEYGQCPNGMLTESPESHARDLLQNNNKPALVFIL